MAGPSETIPESGARTIRPGWYPDPTEVGQLRWFDGAAWTEHRTPDVPDEPASEPAPVPFPEAAAWVSHGAVGPLTILPAASGRARRFTRGRHAS